MIDCRGPAGDALQPPVAGLCGAYPALRWEHGPRGGRLAGIG